MKHHFVPFAVTFFCVIVTAEAGILCYNCDFVPHQRDCGTVLECGDHEICYGERLVTADGITTFKSGCKPKQACDAVSNPALALGKRSTLTVCSKCCNTSNCNSEICDEQVPGFGQRCLSCEYVLQPKDCFISVECNAGEVCYTQSIIHNHERRYRLGCAIAQQCDSASAGASPIASRATQTSNYCGECCSTENCNRDLCYNTSISNVPLKKPPPLTPCRDNSTEYCATQSNRCDEDYFKYYLCPYTCGQCGVPLTDVCATNPCGPHGTCQREIIGYTCQCFAGYSGQRCETDINECESNPCANGGTCQDSDGNFTCSCTVGYTGQTCETDINECESNPCKHGGTCQDGIGHFTCSCTAGVTGRTCETVIGHCEPNPCLNGGSCSVEHGKAVCHCAGFYGGHFCEKECVSSHHLIWNGHCYYVTNLKRPWRHGLCEAQVRNMSKVIINSPEENDALTKFLHSLDYGSNRIWIGGQLLQGHDHHHSHWVWNNGETVNTDGHLWLHGHKDQRSGECLAIYEGKFNGEPCENSYHLLCERPLSAATLKK